MDGNYAWMLKMISCCTLIIGRSDARVITVESFRFLEAFGLARDGEDFVERGKNDFALLGY